MMTILIFIFNNISMNTSDFTYDNQDFTAIRTATADLNRVQGTASQVCFYLSAGYIGWRFATRKASNSLWAKSPALVLTTALIASTLTFTISTWGSRSRLDDAAAHINKKYSNIIARTLNYEGIIQ